MIRRFAIALLVTGASIAVAVPADAATSSPSTASTASAKGDVMCLAIQPYIGYCVGNVPAAVLDALLP